MKSHIVSEGNTFTSILTEIPAGINLRIRVLI